MTIRTAANMSPSAGCCASAACCRRAAPTMQAIVAWMRANPDEGRALMRENLSYIFFKELTGPGPLGALGAAGDAARHGRRRSQVRAARRAGLPRRSTAPRPTACGSRRTPAARSRAPTASTPSGARARRPKRSPAACRPSGRALILLPKGAAARAHAQPLTKPRCGRRVAATIRPLSREPGRSAGRGRAAARGPRRQRRRAAASRRRDRVAAAAGARPTLGSDARRQLGQAAALGRDRARPHARPPRPQSRRRLGGDRPRARAGDRRRATGSCC